MIRFPIPHSPVMKSLIFATLIALGATACSKELALARTEPAKTVAFVVDMGKDFHVELGRGSGMDGLETVAFGRDGNVTLFRERTQTQWQTANLKLSPDAIARIFEVVNTEGIMKMPSAYHADVSDGTQWVLWIKQEHNSKAIYFNNYFPAGVKRLAERLDQELSDARLAAADWKEVPTKKFREHEKNLWQSIK